jgi:hypothetical protein
VPAGAGLKPKDFQLAVVLTLLSNSSQERCRLFGQHPQAHEELFVREAVEIGSITLTTFQSDFVLPSRRAA